MTLHFENIKEFLLGFLYFIFRNPSRRQLNAKRTLCPKIKTQTLSVKMVIFPNLNLFVLCLFRIQSAKNCKFKKIFGFDHLQMFSFYCESKMSFFKKVLVITVTLEYVLPISLAECMIYSNSNLRFFGTPQKSFCFYDIKVECLYVLWQGSFIEKRRLFKLGWTSF